MTAESIFLDYKSYLSNRELKQSTVKLYLTYAKAFLREIYTQSIGYEQVAKYISGGKKRRKNLSGLFSFMLEKGLLNFDKYRNDNNKQIKLLIEAYLRDMRVRDRKQDTVKAAGSQLKLFHCFLKEKDIQSICEVSGKLVTGFAAYLQMKEAPFKGGKPYEPGYRASVLLRVKDFFRYLRREGEILYDPCIPLVVPRLPKRIYRNILSIEEINQVENQIDIEDIFGFRDLCLLETIYATGARAGEASRLKVEDLNLGDRRVLIRQGKGRRDRVVPLNRYTCRLLAHYISNVRPRIIKQTGSSEPKNRGTLFLNIYGQGIHKDWITRMMIRYVKKAGLEKKVSAHTLRHSVASHMLARGAGIRYIQQLLGHRSLSTTQKYTKVVIEQLKETIKKYHPFETEDTEEHED